MDNFDNRYEKKNPFTVPDGYFDQLTDRIMDRVEEKKEPEKISLIRLMKPYLGLAAMFLIALLVVQAIFSGLTDKSRMLRSAEGQAVQETASSEEIMFDSRFNPTNDEIIEYLAAEVDSYELLYADIY